jgi:hypothetical protein
MSSSTTSNLLEEVVTAAEKLRARLGPHWPLILSVPTGVSVDLGVALALAGITVEVDRFCPPDRWYLRDGVKRKPNLSTPVELPPVRVRGFNRMMDRFAEILGPEKKDDGQ